MPHSTLPATSPLRCTATTKAGIPCRAWAVKGTQPPRCAAHGGGRRPAGAPRGNQTAREHGAYFDADLLSIEDVLADLAIKQRWLSDYIETHIGEISTRELISLLKLHGQNASRLGRLLRDKRALSGEAADGIAGAIAQALDELSTELGVEL